MAAVVGLGTAAVAVRKTARTVMRMRGDHRLLQRHREIMGGFSQDLGEVLAGSEETTAQEIFTRVISCAQRAVGAGGATLLLMGEDEILMARATSGICPPLDSKFNEAVFLGAASKVESIREHAATTAIPLGEGLIGEVGFHGQAVMVEDGLSDPRLPVYRDELLAIYSLVAVPMHFRGREIGVLVVVNPINGQSFRPSDVELLQLLADEASLTVHFSGQRESAEKRRRQEKEDQVARRIQNSLLPRALPASSGLESASFSQPAQAVGGDYLDVIEVDEDSIGVAIADVSGKGVGGAIMMSICRTILRTIAPTCQHPAEVLRKLNRMMSEDISEDMFVTMIYMVFNKRTRVLRVACAGHEPLLYWPVGQPCRPVSPAGMAVGLSDLNLFETVIGEEEMVLQPGDMLIIYTDGVVEAQNENEQEWGSAMLHKAIAGLRNRPMREVIAGIRGEVTKFVGPAAQSDDFTILGLRLLPPPRAKESES
jgi:phosphoserine phosphatase RsbU/P